MKKEKTAQKGILTKRDIWKAWIKMWLFQFQCANYERFHNLGLTNAISHILAKLYKTKEELAEALTRHMEFYNNEAYIGHVLLGILIAMEEERGMEGEEKVPAEAISSVKAGLMGPIAGIGDTVNQGIVNTLIFAVCVSLTLDAGFGIWGAVLAAILMLGYSLAESAFFINLGYKFGRNAVSKILEGGLMKTIMTAAGIVGCCVMGALAASYVNISTPLMIGSGEGAISIQANLLDALLPKMLSLLTVLGCYKLYKKNMSPLVVMLILIVAVVVLSVIGIL
ncbi:MAG: PTS system mannose/fructose/sorbose family transporter subunit IID [Christensenellaceae bacterium]|nr:PTS system mannose/fructose/sorbose family transporter subunit IID [Christensenellaceae bacterium]